MDKEILVTILTFVFGILGTVITSVLVPALATWLKSKTKMENLQYVIDELAQTVSVSVDFVNQTFVDQLKADGKFDAEKQKEALTTAIDITMENLSERTLQILGKDGVNIEELITKYIEAKIYNK